MKGLMMATAAAAGVLVAAPLFAQERVGGEDPRAYVTGVGGFSTTVGNTTSDLSVEGGIRIARHLMVFGNAGRFGDLQGNVQSTLDTATSTLAADQGLTLVGSAKMPANYFSGGLRMEVPTRSRAMPYVLGGVGVAHLMPTAQLTFSSGTMPDGSTPDTGTDVTAAVESTGAFNQPAASNAFMFNLGGGVGIRIATHWAVDAGYRYSRIAADSTVSASALNVNGMTFGFGYRF